MTKPDPNEVRDNELFLQYNDRIKHYTFKLEQNFYKTYYSHGHPHSIDGMVPALDHRETDSIEFQNQILSNNDENVIEMIKKQLNEGNIYIYLYFRSC